jgi:hypothetical protein
MKFQDLPIYELKINESLNDESEVSYVALVDLPAIKKDFLAFKEEFINPSKGEHKTEFLPRCISYVINEGKESEQAVAICNSIWEEHFAEDMPHYTKDGKLWTGPTHKDSTGRLMTGATHTKDSEYLYHEGEYKAKNYHNFQIISEDEHIISGPLMLADQLIYRDNEKFGEHYVKFSPDTIKDIAIKFAKRKYQSNVNLMHDPSQVVEGVTMFESFIVDKKRGVLPMTGFEDVADGSWFGSFYVENNEVWNQVKSGELRGFSVEGLFDYEEPKKQLSPEEQALKKIEELLKEIN